MSHPLGCATDKGHFQTSSLELSAALLRAILMNHLAHSEATKAAKYAESQLNQRLEEAEMSKSKLESELKRSAHLSHCREYLLSYCLVFIQSGMLSKSRTMPVCG